MSTSERIVIVGGSGYLGRVLAAALAADSVPVTVVSRHLPPPLAGVDYVAWDGGETANGDWARTLDGAAAVVNLSGRSVNCRYNAANRQQIFDSRLRSTRAVGEAIACAAAPPPV